ncbi:hypothetical protein [Cupriavidus pinatubonensis]|uniref:hypothetical protein n=1 Tax=Cupriavidus pinatubonensis TaxID=248026 RepID=UPI001CC5E9DC|nr:hypothetical protein [Cupriavidus pinatubonensis]
MTPQDDLEMAESQTAVPLKKGEEAARHPWALQAWHPITSLRREMERLFDDFDHGTRFTPARLPPFGLEPLWRHDWSMPSAPSVACQRRHDHQRLKARGEGGKGEALLPARAPLRFL